MTSNEKRPRIPADLAERIDAQRGSLSFEEFVRNLLSSAVGPYRLEPEPKRAGRYRIIGEGGAVLIADRSKREAEHRVYMLAAAGCAMDALDLLRTGGEDAGQDDVALQAARLIATVQGIWDTYADAV